MPANVDTMFYVDATADNGLRPWWVGLESGDARRLQSAPTAREAMIAAGHDWAVEQRDLFLPDGTQAEGWKANVRSDNDAILGVTRSTYKVIQHEALYQLGAALTDTPLDGEGGLTYETAGVISGGKKVWALARMPRHVRIDGDPSDIVPFLMLHTSHDGSSSLGATAGTVRVVCANTYNANIQSAKASHKFRHTASWETRIGEARQALKMSFDYLDAFESVAGDLIAKKMTIADVKKFTVKLLPADPEVEKPVRTERDRDTIVSMFANPAYETLGDLDLTAYRAFNAVTEFVDHHRTYMNTRANTAADNRALSLLDGQGADIKRRALALLAK